MRMIEVPEVAETEATVAAPIEDWSAINWRKLEQHVFRQQRRIYQAEQRGNIRAVHSLQRLLLKSWSARMLAVRRVTQENRGKVTAGVDGVRAVRPKDRFAMVARLADLRTIRAKPVRRVIIPKPGKREGRPLGIPTMLNRAHQALVKMALEPQWEARFEPNSYGFRPGRSCWDAIGAIYQNIHTQDKYVLDADIQGCFDHISHPALLRKLNAPPCIRQAIKAWLAAGVMIGVDQIQTTQGTPQGGVISPLLMNVALHGLEQVVYNSYDPPRRKDERYTPIKARLVRYADDFVVLCRHREGIEAAKLAIEDFLAGMGLQLNQDKTRITHTYQPVDGQVGFDFLGFTIRQWPAGKTHTARRTNGEPLGFRTQITVSRGAINRHLEHTRTIIRAHRARPQRDLIAQLSPLIVGWTNYFRIAQRSNHSFAACEHVLTQQLLRWAQRRHPRKGMKWIVRRYWTMRSPRKWTFAAPREASTLRHHTDTFHLNHRKVRGTASPFDGNLLYWSKRLRDHPLTRTTVGTLLVRQQGRCAWCGLYFRDGDLIEVDHVDPIGGHRLTNKQALHRHCHDVKTVQNQDHRRRRGAV
jgi:RNA-directed DNA polymerase